VDKANPNHRGLSRRHAIARGLTIGAGFALGTSRRPALARTTPAASPTTTGYARPEILIDAAPLMNRLDHPNEPPFTLIALMPADEFAAGHIPGSVQLDWPQMEITDTSDAAVAR
jgi:hypothetical protein